MNSVRNLGTIARVNLRDTEYIEILEEMRNNWYGKHSYIICPHKREDYRSAITFT